MTYDFEVERTKLRDKLQKIPGGISVTTDIWTTETYDKSFMSVTIHYLNSSWKLRSILLDFISMKESHTGSYYFANNHFTDITFYRQNTHRQVHFTDTLFNRSSFY